MKKYFLLLIVVLSIACSGDDDYIDVSEVLYEEGEELLTGVLGVNSTSGNAFGFEIEGLSFQDQAKFATGNSLFNQSWVSSPASTTARDGLGPTFNARACAACHFKDGRGRPLENGATSRGFLMRISLAGQGALGFANPVPEYGLQIQDRANNGIPYEAKVNVSYETISGTYSDGTSYELQKPIYTIVDAQFGALNNVLMSPRVAQQTIGLGFISALPDTEITKFEDEFDADDDGISGKANYVWDVEANSLQLGRYGWKANSPTLKQQITSAFHGDMGLTTSMFPENNCPSPQLDCMQAPNGGEPEVTDTQLENVQFYQANLAVPNRRNFKDESVLKGKKIFEELNCIGCHAINQKTTSFPFSPLLGGIAIKPYSDFLLHDMGEELTDNRSDFKADGREWRTQPLWGIGLIATVNDHTFLLHDGRARNVEEAILWHGGEAGQSKQDFVNLAQEEREQLIDFINSL
ncbi:di-heme oxidoredictase family protein [uncultured Aquimarina sp.]|uniref:di-heme oxidoreductase family protein n=1 Tax=uncultured Aquimarina sp. TaxID=575652 RepID=UPI002638CE59|nr:di-heme oxidoredictase family protein [uncultured Aquimarina sp.]